MKQVAFTHWLETLGTAWVEKDPKLAASICAEDIRYYETPFGKPLKSRKEVEAIWQEMLESQKDITFKHELLVTKGNLGVAHFLLRSPVFLLANEIRWMASL